MGVMMLRQTCVGCTGIYWVRREGPEALRLMSIDKSTMGIRKCEEEQLRS